jgi:hypothetical protein
MRRLVVLSLAVLALATQVACLIWPFPTGALFAGRGRITPQYAEPLKVGVATREHVLLRLGEPDEVLEGGKVLIYGWTEARGIIVIVGIGGGELPGRRSLRLEFGPDGRLTSQAFGRSAAQNMDRDRVTGRSDPP